MIAALAGRRPCLALVRVGDDPASHVYVRNKGRACEEAGMTSETIQRPATLTQQELLDEVARLNADPNVSGILVQMPLPKQIDTQRVLDAIVAALRTAAARCIEIAERFGDDITIHGSTDVAVRGATFSLAFRGIHPHDLSQVLDQRNVCVRAGHHCAKPLMRLLGVNATARASFYVYNDRSDVDALADALDSATDVFGR